MKTSIPVKQVLICDDDEITRLTLSKRISKTGYEVVGEAKSGLEAMNMFMELKPDIVLLDINMPQGNGLTVLSFIRDHSSVTRVVMITGDELNHTSEIVIKALKAGANDYLTKGNFDENRLKKAIGHPGRDSDSFDVKDAHSFIEELELSQKEIKEVIEEKKKEIQDDVKASDDEVKTSKDDKVANLRRMARMERRK